MTKRQRAQVVELLRCAADWLDEFDLVGMPLAGFDLGYVDFINPCERTYAIALDAVDSLLLGGPVPYRHRLLEAAQRVEEKSWP